MLRVGDELDNGPLNVPRSAALGKDSFELDVAYWEAVKRMRDEFAARYEANEEN